MPLLARARRSSPAILDIRGYTTYVGQGSPRFWLGLNPQLPDSAYAQIVILPPGVEARERVKAKIEKAVAEGALSGARVRVTRFDFGASPVDYPVEFRVVGTDPLRLRQIAEEVRRVMLTDPRVVDPNSGNGMSASPRFASPSIRIAPAHSA